MQIEFATTNATSISQHDPKSPTRCHADRVGHAPKLGAKSRTRLPGRDTITALTPPAIAPTLRTNT